MSDNGQDSEQRPIAAQAWLRMLAKEEANKVILQHLNLCPFAAAQVEQRVRSLEARFALLTGFMIGSGLLGGAAGGIIVRVLGG
jgi:hypothetical protein